MAMAQTASPALAQSGVLSGPPQAPPGVARGQNASPPTGPGLGPDYRPRTGPSERAGHPEPAPGTSSATGPGLRLQQAGTWIAVVGGFDRTGKGVSVGYSGHQPSRAAAESAAVKACIRNERSVSCSGVYAVSTGCLYIVPGRREDGGVRWGRGGTRQAAFDECRRGGYTCSNAKMIGGCVPGGN
jgi:hypothetical protein